MNIREIRTGNALTKTRIPGYDWCLNPYVGCAHGCSYCYATFMKRFTRHTEPWGSFIDIKTNAPQALERQVKKIRTGSVIIGSVTDPYQPIEQTCTITRRCLEILSRTQLAVYIQTRSHIITRDIDILRAMPSVEAGFSITTDDDNIRRIFEPHAPSIQSRIDALKALHDAGIRTYVFVGPVLPCDPENLASLICNLTDSVLIDRLNYSFKVEGLIRARELGPRMTLHKSRENARRLSGYLLERGVETSILFE